MREYTPVEMDDRNGNPIYAIKFTDAPYAGLLFAYGKVDMVGDDVADEATLRYDYDIYEDTNESYTVNELEIYLGDFLVELITKTLDAREVVYRGGTDAPRPDRNDLN